MIKFNVNLSEDLHRQFKIHCVHEGKDMSEVVRELIEEYLKRADQKKKSKK